LQRSTNGGAFTEIASGLSAGIYHDTSVAVLTSYAYKAVASNIFGDSPVSDPSNTVTSPQLAALSVPTQNNPTVSGSDVHITTMATPRVAQYEIWRGSTSGGETLLATVNVATGEALDYHDTTVSTDTTYYYKIKAKNAGGTSSFSGEQPIYVPVQAIDPATVSGRILDLDGDSNGADASPVAAWADASPSANNATQGTVSKQPIVVANAVNGHKSVKLDGSDDVLNLGAAITAARTIYIVPKHATGNQDSAPVLGHASTFDFAGGMRNLLLDPTNVSASIKNGHAFVNGFEDPLGAVNLEKPVAFRVLSFVTTGNVSFGNISNDRNVGGRFWNGEYARILAFNTAHSDATRKGIELFLKTRYGATATKVLRRQFIAVGDSQTANLGYQARVVNCLAGNCASASPITDGPWSSITHAFTGYTLADMATYDSAVAGDFNANRIKQVLVLWGGTNDMYFGATGAAAYSRLLDRINAYKAAGHTQFVVLTCLPRSNSGTPAGYETERQDFNTRMRNGAPTQGWTVADIVANATIGDAGDEMNTTYYSDLVHLTNAGHDVIAPIIQAAINSLP
jgi:lysophospholipase L1-like esterase